MVKRTDLGRIMKWLHELGSYGLVGGFCVQLLLMGAGDKIPDSTLAVREISKWLLTPSLLAVIASGVLAMFIRTVFFAKGWVWLKILLTFPTFYATLATHPQIEFGSPERSDAILWVAVIASVVITFLSVWRPKGILSLG